MPNATAPALRRAIELAGRAPSAHNTQPWRVRVEGDCIEVRADATRWLRHTDPARRDLRLGVGAFVEALQIALRGGGTRYEVVDTQGDASATLRFVGGCEPDVQAASLLRRRESSRLAYSPREPEPQSLRRTVVAAGECGVELHLIARGSQERIEVDRWFRSAAREAWLDARATAELARWIRLDFAGFSRSSDGLSTRCLDLRAGEALGFGLAIQPAVWRAASCLYAAGPLAAALARTEADAVERAPFVGVLVDRGTPATLNPGAALLRFWLAATGERLAVHPISTLIDRRGWDLARRLGTTPARLLFAFRLGRSAPPPRSARRAVDEFTAFV